MADQAKLSAPLSPVREYWMPTEQAIEQYLAYEERYGRGHALLACHAAFPLIVTPELVNLIRLNFLADQAIDWLAEADFLLAFCQPIDAGLGLYQIDPGLRSVMLADLQESEYGLNRLYELADFLLAYGERYDSRIWRSEITHIHQWISWVYLCPQKLANEIQSLLLVKHNDTNSEIQLPLHQIHIITLIEVIHDAFAITSPHLVSTYQEFLKIANVVAHYWYSNNIVTANKSSNVKIPISRVSQKRSYSKRSKPFGGSKRSKPFGKLLKEAVHQIAQYEQKSLAAVQDELGYGLNREGAQAIYHWRRGNVPETGVVEKLARMIVARSDLEKSWLRSFLTSADYPYTNQLCDELFRQGAPVPPQPEPESALPISKEYRQLIGRDEEIKRLMAVISDRNAKSIIGIDGMGGIGKSALAYEVAALAQSRGLFQHVVWLHSADEAATFGSTITFDLILDRLAQQLGISVTTSTQARAAQVKLHLRLQPALLVLDNLDLANSPQQTLLTKLQPLLGQSKVIATSRQRFYGDIFEVHLTGLTDIAGRLFLLQEGRERGMESLANAASQDLDQLVAVTGGVPLAMKVAVGHLNFYPLTVILEQFRTAELNEFADLYKQFFSAFWELLSPQSQNLLISMVLSLPDTGGDFEMITEVSKLSSSEVSKYLIELWRLSLIDSRDSYSSLTQKSYYINPLIRNFVISKSIMPLPNSLPKKRTWQQMKPVVNPFIFWEPLRGRPPFVGRDSELRALKKAGTRGSLQPVLLSGLFRSGKRSLIHKAMFEYKDDIIFVTFNVPDPDNNGLSLLSTYWALYQNLKRRIADKITDEEEEKFRADPANITEKFIRVLCGRFKIPLVIAISNVEQLYPVPTCPTYANDQVVATSLFAFWWKLMQGVGNLSFVFVSEASALPNTPFTPLLKKIRLNNLGLKDVLKLLTTPTPEFTPLFAPATIEYIFELTAGQPYLVQLIAYSVIDQFNEELEKENKPEPVFIPADVDAILASESFRQFSEFYFQTLCDQLERLQPGSNSVLRAVAQDVDGMNAADLEQNLRGEYQWSDIELILTFLAMEQVIQLEEGRFKVIGELLRQTVAGK